LVNKILLLTHYGWGKSLLKSVEMILGKVDFVYEIPLTPELSFDDYRNAVSEFLGKSDGQYVIMTDVFGGTPTTVASVVVKDKDIDIITGLNSPLLIEACSRILFDGGLDVENLLKTTKNSIFDVKKKMGLKGSENNG
jgi:D-glucosaminate-specific PTS system IIA component